jgi:hypothetical protein
MLTLPRRRDGTSILLLLQAATLDAASATWLALSDEAFHI